MPTALKRVLDRKQGEQLLKDSQELSLTTIGRKSRKVRTVELWFVYEEGLVWLLTGKDRNGPTSHWARNLLANPNASVRIGRTLFRARATKVDNSAARVPLLLEAYRAKYGEATVSQFYGGMPRTPMALRITWPRAR